MIVFPLIRSVGLKAATASSRAATLPSLSAADIPATLDDLTQWGAIGYDDEVDSHAVSGRASVRPAMVTSVPPARITPADRFAMSPPRDIENQIDPADIF